MQWFVKQEKKEQLNSLGCCKLFSYFSFFAYRYYYQIEG